MKVTKKNSDGERHRQLSPYDAPFVSLREAMNRLFDESFWDPFDQSHSLMPWDRTFPKVDISESDKEVRVSANVPGVDPDNMEIEVDEDSIRLSGTLEKEDEQEGEKFYSYEREYGEFHREFALPSQVDPDSVKADVKDGVLTVRLPKVAKQKRKKVKVGKK